MKLIPFFRAGRHLDSQGRTVEFTEADLDASIAGYDPVLHRAPLVIGHPRSNGPAYGWVRSIGRNVHGEAAAVPEQLHRDFAEGVASGAWYPRSASWYGPTDPRNPKPGIYYLRHIGFLGAQPPAIKGLSDIEFDDAEGILEIEFADPAHETSASLWRRLRDWLIADRGLEVADQVIPDWQIDSLAEAGHRGNEPQPAFSEPTHTPEKPAMTPEEIAALQAENERLKNQVQQQQDAQRQQRREAAHAANIAFAEGLVAQGMKPVHVPVLVAALDFAEAGDSPLEFGEGESRVPLAAGLKAAFGELAGAISFTEQARKDRHAGKTSSPAELEFAEARTDPDRLALHARATALAADQGIPYESAVRRLINQ